MDRRNYQQLIRCLIEISGRLRYETQMNYARNCCTFSIFSFLMLVFALWLSSALLLFDKSTNEPSKIIITPSPDGYNCNNLALNFWPFIWNKRRRGFPSKLISKWFFILLILCAGDVHPNPGPGLTETNENQSSGQKTKSPIDIDILDNIKKARHQIDEQNRENQLETPQEKRKRLKREKQKRWYANHQAEKRAYSKLIYNTPAGREKKIEQSKRSYKTPEGRERNIEHSKRSYKTPEGRERNIEHSKRSYKTPEGRERNIEHSKRSYKTPEGREKKIKLSKRNYETPEGREKKQEQSKCFSKSSYRTPAGCEKKKRRSKIYYEQNKTMQRLKKDISIQKKRRKEVSALNPKVRYIQKGSAEFLRRNQERFRSFIINRFIKDLVQSEHNNQSEPTQLLKMKRKASARISVRQLVFKLEPIQKRVIKKMRDKLRSVITKYYQEFENALKSVADLELRKIDLTNLYAGDKSQHVSTHEHYGSSIPFDAYTGTGEQLASRVLSNDDEENPEKEGTHVKGPPYIRQCDDNCILPKDWAIRLHSAIGRLDPDLPFLEIEKAVLEFETCRNCDNITGTSDRYRQCGDNCRNMIKLCRLVMPHYPKMRNLLRRIYEIRECNIWLSRIDDCCFRTGSWVEFTRLMNLAPKKSQLKKKDIDCGRRIFVSEQEIEKKYKIQIRRYERELHVDNHPIFECSICHLLFKQSDIYKYKDYVTIMEELNKSEKINPQLTEQRLFYLLKESPFPVSICTPYCLADLKNCAIPRFSSLNNMDLDEVPEEIQVLNTYELMLIKLAKTFQTVIRLKPLSGRGKWGDHIQARKGNAVHLPIPLNETIKYIHNNEGEITSDDSLQILVDGIPTGQSRHIWRSVVDLGKITKAIQWLKDNNKLYKNVNIVEATEKLENSDPIMQGLEMESTEDEAKPVLDQPNLQPQTEPMVDKAGDEEPGIRHYTIHQLQTEQPNTNDTDLYRFKRITGQALYEKEPNLDLLCYPEHYPKGQHGMYYPRQTRIMPAMYVKARLRHRDPRFRRDHQMLFHWSNNKDMRAVDSGMYATMNITKAGPMNAKQLKQKLLNRDEEIEANLTTLLSQVRGTKEYWLQRMGDLNAMDEKFGPATFFITLSCAEYRWPELLAFLKQTNRDISNVDSMTQSSLCASDPVSVAMHFQQRFASFMKNVIEDKNGPLGEVEHWFWRLEYQARGAPHIHMKIWVKDAPIFGKDPDDKVLQFIQNHITCEIPDIIQNPRLHDLVDTFQNHSCSNSCKRLVSIKGKKFRKCRFGFPRAVISEPSLNSLEEAVRSRRHARNVIKIYNLFRSDKEQFFNDYNPAILLLWKANMDIQYVGESSLVLNRYITSYISKSEKQATADIWESINQNKSLWSRLKSFALKSFKYREQSAYEVADRLLGHPLYGSNDAIVWCAAQMNRRRRMKPYKQVLQMGDEDRKIYFQNMIDDYYPNRPFTKKFNDMCLYELVTNYEYKREINTQDKARYHKLVDINGFFYEKAKPCVVKTPIFKPYGDSRENYFHQLLMLFRPWRKEGELLCDKLTYQDAFDSVKEDLQMMTTFLAARKRIEKAIEIAESIEQKAAEEEAHEDINEEVPEPNLAASDGDTNSEFQKTAVSEENLSHNIESLNSEQRHIFDVVVNHVTSGQDGEAMKMFVSGVAGTGKSFLIQTVCDTIRHHYGDESGEGWVVAVLAPTGLAAFNVNGMTNHQFFKLPVQHGAEADYWQLPKAQVKLRREQLKNLKLIIIDELSMISNETLVHIHRRLDEIFGGSDCNQTFGNKNLLCFGDLLQLPPVNSEMIFKQRKIGGVNLVYDFWNDFEYNELTQNMRQAEDEQYANALNRIRIGSPTEADIEMLITRLIDTNLPVIDDDTWIKVAAQYFQANLAGKKALCLLPLASLVQKFNFAMLELNGIEPIIIAATDSQKKVGRPKKNKTSMDQTAKNPASHTAGLETDLVIGIGARVMLRRNLDTQHGLVNGAMGVVRGTEKNRYGVIYKILVQFDGQDTLTQIEPFMAEYELGKKTNVFVTRQQFPLTLAYAVTIHKSQGLSLDAVLLDIGSSIFECGMVYVALSRAKRLSGVHLIRFDPTKISCKRAAVIEYNRLRTKYTNLPTLPESNKLPHKYGYTSDFYYKHSGKRNTGAPTGSINPTEKVQPKATAEDNQKKNDISYLPLRFKNSGSHDVNSCYGNAVVQALMGLNGLKEMILSITDNDIENVIQREAELCKSLANWTIAENNSCKTLQTTFQLRRLVDGIDSHKYQTCNQQDCAEFLLDLLGKLPLNVQSLFWQKKTSIRTCSVCNNIVNHTVHEVPEWEHICTRSPSVEKMQFCDLFRPSKLDSPQPCQHCANYTEQELRTNLQPWDANSRYLILRINHLFGNEEAERIPAESEINGFLSNGTTIFGKRYHACSAITHIGTEQNGHYLCWRKFGEQWLLIDDNVTKKITKRFVPGLRTKSNNEFGYHFIYILVLERI